MRRSTKGEKKAKKKREGGKREKGRVIDKKDSMSSRHAIRRLATSRYRK